MPTKPELLQRRLAAGERLVVLGAGDALTAQIAEATGFDAVWASGLCISALSGLPDNGALTMTELANAAEAIDRRTALPVIADCDTGFGPPAIVARTARMLELRGVAGMCIEDKVFPKRNSFREGHQLADPYEFATRLHAALSERRDPGFLVIARTEALIAGESVTEALERAEIYATAGASAIVIHSKSKSADDVLTFARTWSQRSKVPSIAIPTTYHSATADQLFAAGIQLVIYANQALRASVRAVESTIRQIAAERTAHNVEHRLLPLDSLFELTGVERDEDRESVYADAIRRRHILQSSTLESLQSS